MENQVLSIEQMQHLYDLGVDNSKASMCWIMQPGSNMYEVSVYDEYCHEMSCLNPVPTFTLQDMLEMMPRIIYEEVTQRHAHLAIDCTKDKIGISYLVGSYIMLKDYCAVGSSFIEAAMNKLYEYCEEDK